MQNGVGISYYSKNSNYLWIGDSRMVQMYKFSGKDSVVACWAGHYNSLCDGYRCKIDNSDRMQNIKKIIKKSIKKFGVANVVLVPTINDYTGPRSAKYTVQNYMAVYKKIKKISKKIHIMTPSLIPKYGRAQCESFNNKVKKKVMHYVKVRFKAKHYALAQGDRVHFSKKGLKYLRKRIYSVSDGDSQEIVVTASGYVYMG